MSEQTTPEVVPQPEEQKARRKPGPKPKPPVPALCRMVIYVTDLGAERAAVITAVHEDERVDLMVFNAFGAFPALDVPFSADDMETSWHWPVRD